MSKRITEQEREEILFYYENSDYSAQEIADMYNRSRNSVIGLANRHDVEFWSSENDN